MGGDVTFVDESEIVKEDLRTQGLGPTIGIENSSFIFFSSTVSKGDSWMQKYYDDPKYSEPDSLVRAMALRSLCKACLAQDPLPLQCEHDAHLAPSHLDPKRMELMQDFIGSGTSFKQEVLNIPQDRQAALLRRDDILHLLTHDRLSLFSIQRLCHDPTQTLVLHFVDPNGGSGKAFEGQKAYTSRLGVVSVMANMPRAGHWTVLGKMAVPCRNFLQRDEAVSRYCEGMVRYPFFRQCRHVLVVEPNFGGEVACSQYFAQFAHYLPNLEPLIDYDHGFGVPTTRNNKYLAGRLLCSNVSLRQLHLLAPPDCFENLALRVPMEEPMAPSGSTVVPPEGSAWTATERILYDELVRFHCDKNNFNSKGSGSDDLVISLMMARQHLDFRERLEATRRRDMNARHQLLEAAQSGALV